MNKLVIIVIGALLFVIVLLVMYNFHIQKKVETYNNINQQISNLSVLQEFMKVAGEEDTVEAKLNKINDIVIEQYDIKLDISRMYASSVLLEHFLTLTRYSLKLSNDLFILYTSLF